MATKNGDKAKVGAFTVRGIPYEEGHKLWSKNNAESPITRAAALEGRGQFDRAIKVVEDGIEQHPRDRVLRSYLSSLLRRARLNEASQLGRTHPG